MIAGFICPFCHTPLYPVTFGYHECKRCDLHFDANLRIANFGDKAPEYLSESLKFIDEFLNSNALFAMGPVKLFEQGFMASDVLYYTEDTNMHRLTRRSEVMDNHLLAGNGIFAKNLLRNVVFQFDAKSEVSPLTQVHKDAKSWLFYYIVLMSVPCSFKVPLGLHAYLQPTVEGMCNILLHMPHKSIGALTDEQVLYTAIFAQPQLNIEWAPERLDECVKSYIKALTDFTPNTRYMPYSFEECVTDFPDAFMVRGEARKLYNMYLGGNVGTAANGGLSSFDILNKCYLPLKGPGPKMTSKQLQAYVEAFGILESLFTKYASATTPSGLKLKSVHLEPTDPQDTADDIVMSFWSRVNLKLGGGGFLP